MTKRKAAAQCPNSPTGAHSYVMSWPEPGVYIGTCRYCNKVKHEDPTFGEGQERLRAMSYRATMEGECSE